MCMKHAPLLNLMKTKASLLRVARVGTRSIKSVNDANRKTTNQSFRKKFTLKILLSSEKAEKSPPPNNWTSAGLKKRIRITRTSFREFRTQLRELLIRTHLYDLENAASATKKTEVSGFNRTSKQQQNENKVRADKKIYTFFISSSSLNK